MDNIKYICDLIVEKNGDIFFKPGENHFENFLESPKTCYYYSNNKGFKNNILFI